MPNRFTILHHRTPDGEHWDLMLEQGDVLLTWQLPRRPASGADLPLPARRIADHRKRYLDYEGPINGNRGDVTRIEAGTVTFLESTSARFELELHSPRFAGRFALRRAGDDWEFVSVPEPAAPG
ncbi:MAG: hypothetical protein HY763_10025 [Planctomycetes bacterium]|nr:hypothetical protein [Planctomycetota bacterium]